MFLGVIDKQLKELNDRFDEVNTDLLICMSTFSHKHSFASFDKDNLVTRKVLSQGLPKHLLEAANVSA